MLVSLYFVQTKYAERHKQEILSINRNVLEFFCSLLNTEFFSELQEKFQVASTHDTKVEYQF